ncbi:MAG: indolepyruvate oxidoreductase subunit beta, partial [Deltaproteobacteria bacterium HGW-Deltaproteobacteria-16]
MKQGNIHFCGVGGQGILLASELTAHALLAAGFDAKKSEVHGMAQRGGSVEAHLRFSTSKVY